MEVEINELQSTVRAVDHESLLSPQMINRIIRLVLAAVDDRDNHRKRVKAEQRITDGVSHELEEQE
jgi:hypothetical protein